MPPLPPSTNSRYEGAPAAAGFLTLLALVLAERSLIALNLRLLKPSGAEQRPPEAYATLVFLPLIATALAFAMRRRNGGDSVAATGK